jgi:phosphopantothenoylcysteine decarboxylase/phosphopantothenate--cysteine ligase
MMPGHLEFSRFRGRSVHVGVTGSIAAYKTLDFCRTLVNQGVSVSATLSEAAQQFVSRLSFEALDVCPVHTGMFQASEEVYAHLEPGRGADLLFIAPATANTLAKLANGLADTMLTCQALAFSGPCIVAPAMNPRLWSAPATQENLDKLRQRNVTIVSPGQGQVACGDSGTGKLAPLEELIFTCLRGLSDQDLAGTRVLLTLGPTREHWDPVRYWSNPSTGRMGAALAVAAWLRGAQVHCVCGPCEVWLPPDMARTDVQSAAEMHAACLDLWPGMDIGCLTAAVCDFRPAQTLDQKFKKKEAPELSIPFAPNPDILKALGEAKTGRQRLIGFAAETSRDLVPLATEKLRSKNVDLMAANQINEPRSGFAQATNKVCLVDRNHRSAELPVMSKADIAWKIWDWILQL